MSKWQVALTVLVHLNNFVWTAECTISQVRLEIDIWEKRIEAEMEFYE